MLRERWQSLVCAARGLGSVFASQVNARIHAAASIAAIGAGWWLRIAAAEWALVVAAIAMVWAAEALNTAIEHMVDLISPDAHPLAGKAKDAAAGAVLAASIGAALIGAFVFGPRLAGCLLSLK